MKKSEKIEILNSRRIKLKENSMRLREEKERLTRRLERLRNNLDEMEAEEATLESIIIDQLDFKKMMVSVHVVEEFTHTRLDRLMLMIKIDGINAPIFKMLSCYETELLAKAKKTADNLTLENRIYIYAKNHIEVFSKLNENGDFELNIEKSVDDYLNDFTVEPRINRHIFF
jgi:hypothetical protein